MTSLIQRTEAVLEHNERLIAELKQANSDLGNQYFVPITKGHLEDARLINSVLVNLLNHIL